MACGCLGDNRCGIKHYHTDQTRFEIHLSRRLFQSWSVPHLWMRRKSRTTCSKGLESLEGFEQAFSPRLSVVEIPILGGGGRASSVVFVFTNEVLYSEYLGSKCFRV